MNTLNRFTPSPAMLVAILALLVALSGSAYAAAKINGKNIKSGTVTSKQVKNGSLTGKDIKKGSIGKSNLAADAIIAGPAGPAGPKGEAGDAGFKNVVTRTAVSPNIPDGNTAGGTINCQAGEKALSGGVVWVNSLTQNVMEGMPNYSFPLASDGQLAANGDAPVGWSISATNGNGGPLDLVQYVLCAD